MQLFTSDFLTAEWVLKNLALFLLVVALGMPTLFILRLVALVAGILGVILASYIHYDPSVLFWSVCFVLMALLQIRLGRSRKFGRALNKDEQLFHKSAVPMLADSQARMLLTAGHWVDLAAGTTMTTEGQSVGKLWFVASGVIDIIVGGKKVAQCNPGDFVGEIGISTGEAAMATAIVAGQARCLEFDAARLYRLLDGRTELLVAVETAVQANLRDKLQRANQRVAGR